jgi:hypothetical protein
MTEPVSDGGAQISDYELQLLLPKTDKWLTVQGGESHSSTLLNYTVTSQQVRPSEYVQARYRCKNEIGYGEFSPIGFLLMAGAPSAPPAPEYVSSDDSSITIRVLTTLQNNGSPVKSHKVWRDQGDFASDLNEEET